jgi:polysaccharide deacetylase 2 family uncharacterized protein YibQ
VIRAWAVVLLVVLTPFAAQAQQTAAELFARLGPARPQPSAPAAPLRAWQQYAVPAAAADGRPRIAIVIDDVGVNVPTSRRAVELPGPLTISLMTYAMNLSQLAEAARAGGHELLLHVPMEPEAGDVDPGPNVLIGDAPREELQQRIRWALDRVPGVVGINNHMGSRFTANRTAMDALMAELARRGLLFLDSMTTGHSVGKAASKVAGVPYLARDVFLDNDPDVAAVRARLRELEAVARKDGSAIAIAHPKPGTLQALREWLPTMEERGLVLVPLTALVAQPAALAARAP